MPITLSGESGEEAVMEDKNKGIDIVSLIMGLTKGEKSLTLDAGEGYTITDPNNDGHLVITIEEATP